MNRRVLLIWLDGHPTPGLTIQRSGVNHPHQHHVTRVESSDITSSDNDITMHARMGSRHLGLEWRKNSVRQSRHQHQVTRVESK